MAPEQGRNHPYMVRTLAWMTFTAVFVINILGFTDTVTGSALGCGRNWPLCNGEWWPSTWTKATAIEYTHRVSVILGGVLMMVWAIIAWRRYRLWWEARAGVTLMLGGVLVQGVLGALAVLFVNPTWVMALHMGVALLSLIGAYQLAIVSTRIEQQLVRSSMDTGTGHILAPFQIRPERVDPRFRRLVRWVVPYVFVAVYIGAYVAESGTGTLALGWPLPQESPAVGWPFWVDVVHRSVALSLLLWMAILYGRSRKFAEYPQLRRGAGAALTLVILQALSGAYLIASHLSVFAFLIHASIVSCLVCVLCQLALEVGGDQRPVLSPQWSIGRRPETA